jgi:hypothetical protein
MINQRSVHSFKSCRIIKKLERLQEVSAPADGQKDLIVTFYDCEKLIEPYHLEEGEVAVKRYPLVHLRKDH